MSDIKQIADKYVSRGGAVHGQYDQDARLNDILTLGSFMAWQEPHEMCGGYRADDAWAAMCRLMDWDQVALRKVFRDGG